MVVVELGGDVSTQKSKCTSIKVTFLEVEVHVIKVHILGHHVTSSLGLAPLGLEHLMLLWIGDDLHLAIITLLNIASIEDALE